MSNVLSEEQRQQVIALGRLGWPLRRIQQATGVRRETASIYLTAAGIAVRRPGRPGGQGAAKPAIQVTTGSDAAKPAIPINPNPENLSPKGKGKTETSKPAIQATTRFGVDMSTSGIVNPKCIPSARTC